MFILVSPCNLDLVDKELMYWWPVMSRNTCGERVTYYEIVPEEKVSPDLASKTWIQWFIGKDEAPTFAMRMFRVEPDGHIKAHHHPWEREIYVLDGVGEVRIGSRVYRVSKGFFIYIPPNVEHEYWNRSDKDFIFLCVIPVKPSVESSEKKEC